MKLKNRIETLENTIVMMDLFQQIKMTKYSEADKTIMSKKLITLPIYLEGKTYLDELEIIMEFDNFPMHICKSHQELLPLWQELADNYWED